MPRSKQQNTLARWRQVRKKHSHQGQCTPLAVYNNADTSTRGHHIHYLLGKVLARRARLLLLGRHEPNHPRNVAAPL